VSFVTKKTGEYFVTAMLNFVHISGSPFIVYIEEGDCYASKCTAWGPGLTMTTCGDVALFYIKSVDKFGNDLKEGGEPFEAKLEGPQQHAPVEIEDMENGIYVGTYRITVRGVYKVHIHLNGVPICDSPFTLRCACGPSDPKQSFNFNHLAGTLIAGQSTRFGVETRDVFNNAVGHGGLQWQLQLHCYQPTDDNDEVTYYGTCEDLYDGTYELSYTVSKAGEYEVSVTCQGEHCRNSPFPLFVRHSEPYCRNTEIFGSGLGDSVAGEWRSFQLCSKDYFGNTVRVGGATVKATLKMTQDDGTVIDARLQEMDIGNGTYELHWNAIVAGTYTLTCELQGHPVPGIG
jgi:hypothetical protein